jgi:hypothetical protein
MSKKILNALGITTVLGIVGFFVYKHFKNGKKLNATATTPKEDIIIQEPSSYWSTTTPSLSNDSTQKYLYKNGLKYPFTWSGWEDYKIALAQNKKKSKQITLTRDELRSIPIGNRYLLGKNDRFSLPRKGIIYKDTNRNIPKESEANIFFDLLNKYYNYVNEKKHIADNKDVLTGQPYDVLYLELLNPNNALDQYWLVGLNNGVWGAKNRITQNRISSYVPLAYANYIYESQLDFLKGNYQLSNKYLTPKEANTLINKYLH